MVEERLKRVRQTTREWLRDVEKGEKGSEIRKGRREDQGVRWKCPGKKRHENITESDETRMTTVWDQKVMKKRETQGHCEANEESIGRSVVG